MRKIPELPPEVTASMLELARKRTEPLLREALRFDASISDTAMACYLRGVVDMCEAERVRVRTESEPQT